MSSRRNRTLALGALAVAGLVFVIITASGIGENLIYYWGPTELKQAGRKAVGATIRLGGQVRPGSIRQTGGSSLEFDVTDGKDFVHVRSSSIPPQMFRENIGVVVEGTVGHDGVFVSERLMVSHGNEYEPPKPGEKIDAKQLMQTVSTDQPKDAPKTP